MHLQPAAGGVPPLPIPTDGWEVLEDIRADPELSGLPVIIMTTSDVQSDVQRAYDRHANCFLTKPVELEDFIRMITLLKDFWLTAVRLPPA